MFRYQDLQRLGLKHVKLNKYDPSRKKGRTLIFIGWFDSRQQTKNIYITRVQCWTNVEDVCIV